MASSALKQGTAVTVATAGTRQQLSSTVTNASLIYIEADISCPAYLFIGSSAVSSTAYIACLRSRESVTFSAESTGGTIDPSSIYVDASANNSTVRWGYI